MKKSFLLFAFLLLSLGSLYSQSRDATSSISLSGRVLEEDGQPPEDLVQIDLVCNGRIRQQTLTKPDGTFVFDLDPSMSEGWLDPASGGSATGAMEGSAQLARPGRINLDEVPSMGRGRVSMTGCEVRATPKPGIASNTIALKTRSSFDNPEIGVLLLRRLENPSATTVSVSTLKAPEKALKAYQKAQEQLAKENPDLGKAEKELKNAIKQFPEFSAAWDLLARVHLSDGEVEEGRKAFNKAIEAEPGFVSPYLGLAQLGVQEANWPEAAGLAEKILELDTGQLQALYWHGLSNYYLGQYSVASQSLSRLYEKARPEDYPFGLLPLGVSYATQGKIQEASDRIHQYLQLMPEGEISADQRIQLQQQLANWEAEGLATPPTDSN